MNQSDDEYKKWKNVVKLWEHDFRKRENRPPSKTDIKLAPITVREAYKQYWLAKTSILEETILDEKPDVALPEENIDDRETSTNTTSKKESFINFSNKDSVWGEHLKIVSDKPKEVKLHKSSSFEFTEKLFKGIKLKKRNHRKFGLGKQSTLPHTESMPESCSQNSIPDLVKSPEKSVEQECTNIAFDSVKIIEGASKIVAHPVTILQLALNPNKPRVGLKNKLDEGWLNRCQQQCVEEVSEPTVKDNQAAPEQPKCEAAPQHSDDEYVYSSDDETLTKLKDTSSAIGRIISKLKPDKKRPAEELPRSSKKLKTSEKTQEDKIQRLQEKLKNGTVNDNFVKVNLKRKHFSRGKKTITSAKYKIQQWKMKKKEANSTRTYSNNASLILKCFRCGDVGHFMRQCKKQDTLLPIEEEAAEDDSPFLTIEEAAAMAKEKKNEDDRADLQSILESEHDFDKDDSLNFIPPLYKCQPNGTLEDTPNEVFEALKQFGYKNFRAGQERAVMRVLSGKSTLMIAGTGSGKSLCYQLPAYLYAQRHRCISLVISPLVSLMEDQILNFPACLKAACLHTNQTVQAREKIVNAIQNNEISVLLVSPEAMVSGERGILGHTLMQNFPPVAFVCIDEVHCVSQWSHNFRTSYLMICKILRERFNIKTFLGLTATASKSSIASIIQHLGIDDNDLGIVQEGILPDNLVLSVSKDECKDTALVALLKEPPFSEFDSIIIYCLRRNECERVASFLRTSLQNSRKKLPMFGERCTISSQVEVYHAGLSTARRKKVQNYFMKGKLQIIVATVAFGMGINKSDIRGVIHYNMPRTFEHYVQEIGRAGRDGLLASCHLFYDYEGNDLPELKRHIYCDSLDRPTIRELLYRVFPHCSCKDSCRLHEVTFSVENTIRDLDLGQENISTILCYLELLPEKIVQVLPVTYTKCIIVSYNGFLALKRAAKKCPPLAFAIAQHCQNTKSKIMPSRMEFSVFELADRIGWTADSVKRELKRCEWTQVDEKWRKTGIAVSFQDLGFHVRSPGNLNDEQLNDALDSLYNRVTSQEKIALHQLKLCDSAFSSIAYDTVSERNACENEELLQRDKKLKTIILSYFNSENECEGNSVEVGVLEEQFVISNIHRLVSTYSDCSFNARSIARIFHGIESPNFPALVWGRTPYWRCALKEDFNALYKLACRELIKFR